jgi:DNA repair protein RadC
MIPGKICDLNNNDKPRERLMQYGVQNLSNPELLALLLRSGGEKTSALDLSNSLLMEFGGFKGLQKAGTRQLINFKHVGLAKAASIKSACEIAIRINLENDNNNQVITKPKDIYEFVKKDLFNQTRENLYLLSLDSRNKVISKNLISIGTVNETLIHPREVYRTALLNNAVSIALAHNHPSGDPNPSSEDIKITQRIAKAGSEVGIHLLDHIVACDHKFTSLRSLSLITNDHIFPKAKGGE